jgi:uncharacterized membrane protein (DUF441 family)
MLVATLLMITAFAVGFAMKRSALCTYVAAQQIVHQGNYDNLLSFLAAAAWGALFIVPLSWLYAESIKLSMTHSHLSTALVGGGVLGLGAYLNRCAPQILYAALINRCHRDAHTNRCPPTGG